MATGIGIKVIPGDNGPAIELTAGVRCASWLANNTMQRINTNDNKTTQTFKITPYPGAFVFTIPTVTAGAGAPMPPNLLTMGWTVSSISTSATAVSCRMDGNYQVKHWPNPFPTLRTYQVLPAETQGFKGKGVGDKVDSNWGIKLTNSTNFTNLSSSALVGQCIWKGKVTVSKNGWSAPRITGYSPSQYLIFAHWDNANAFLDFNPDSNTIKFYQRQGQENNTLDVANVEIVIFCAGAAAIPAHNGGVTIRNAAGSVTFSTARAPFLLKGTITTPGGNGSASVAAPAGVSRMMVPIFRTGIYVHHLTGNDGKYIYYYRGMRMSGNKLDCNGATEKRYDDTDQYGPVFNPPGVACSVTIPVIDAANYI